MYYVISVHVLKFRNCSSPVVHHSARPDVNVSPVWSNDWVRRNGERCGGVRWNSTSERDDSVGAHLQDTLTLIERSSAFAEWRHLRRVCCSFVRRKERQCWWRWLSWSRRRCDAASCRHGFLRNRRECPAQWRKPPLPEEQVRATWLKLKQIKLAFDSNHKLPQVLHKLKIFGGLRRSGVSGLFIGQRITWCFQRNELNETNQSEHE